MITSLERQRAESEAAAAAAYAEQQKQYMAMHQEAIETKAASQRQAIGPDAGRASKEGINSYYRACRAVPTPSSLEPGI